MNRTSLPKQRLPPTNLRAKTQTTTVVPPEALRKNRTIVWTGAVAVIVIAGSILGAQLKSRTQAKERRQGQQALEAQGPHEGELDDAVKSPNSAGDLARSTVPAKPSGDIQKQIAFLEDQRGRLMGQRQSLETKLETVRGKMKREQELKIQKDQMSQSTK